MYLHNLFVQKLLCESLISAPVGRFQPVVRLVVLSAQQLKVLLAVNLNPWRRGVGGPMVTSSCGDAHPSAHPYCQS